MERAPETRLFRSHWQDGTLDLVAGCAVLLIGLGYVFGQMLAVAVVVPMAFAAWFILRKQVVEPRAGYVEFSRRRRKRTSLELAGATGVGVGLLLLILAAIARGAAPGLREAVAALPALLVAVASLIAAGLTRAGRFALYAAVLTAAGAATIVLDTGPGMPLLAGGAIIAATGAVLLARFFAGSRRFEEREEQS